MGMIQQSYQNTVAVCTATVTIKEISVRTELVGMGFFDLQSIFYQQLLLSCAVKTTSGVLFSVGVFVCLSAVLQ